MGILRAYATAPVALGAVVWSDRRTTVLAKSIFLLTPQGRFELEPVAEPLSMDAFDARGELLHPTDFAPYKPGCDVVLGGLDAAARSEAGHLVLGGLACSVGPMESLGPRESFCPGGDPTDPSVLETWNGGAMDFSRFQCAGPRQRTPWPTQAFDVELTRGALRLRGRYLGPWPSLTVEAPSGARAAVAMPLDTIVLIPSEGRLIAVWRAIVDTPSGGEHRVFVDLPSLDRPTAPVWSEVALTTPAQLRDGSVRRTVAMAPEPEGTAIAPAPAPMAWPFGRPPAEAPLEPPPPPAPEHTRSAVLRTPARTLPFQRQERGPTPARSAPSDFGALRAGSQEPVQPAWDAREGTVTARGAQSASAVLPPTVVATAPPSPSPVEAPPTAGDEADDSSADRVGAIQREIWRGDRPLQDILADHGLTEAAWRALRRARKS